jgi:hypothetical protein
MFLFLFTHYIMGVIIIGISFKFFGGIMKKLSRPLVIVFLVLVLTLFTSCFLIPLSPSISPPGWIIGVWADEFDINTFTFTEDNIIFTGAGTSIDFKKAFRASSFEELVNTETQYKVQIIEGGLSTNYDFAKKTPTTLDYSLSTITIELIKQ